jgi:mono/diheme cytochrome c family protein
MTSPASQTPLLPTSAPRPPRLGPIPRWAIGTAVVLTIGSWAPLAFFARARVSTSDEPPSLLLQDMHAQPKYRQQQTAEIFPDGRAMRPRVEGTLAQGMSQDDDRYYRGWTQTVVEGKPQVRFFEEFPVRVTVDERLLARGKERFGVFCAACHGLDGAGKGMVHIRATELHIGNWVQPSDLADATRVARPVGHLFNTITVGIRNMPGYGGQIPVEDRWAIIAYVRALQLSRNAPMELVPADQLR